MTHSGEQPEIEPPAQRKLKPFGLWSSTFLGTAVGTAFFLAGHVLIVGNQESFGSVMFLLVPFVAGFSIAAVTRNDLIAACCVTTCIFSLAILISVGWEGYICCLMALPLIGAGIAVGALVGYYVRGRYLDTSVNSQRNTTLLLVVGPLLLAGANEIEKPLRNVQRVEWFETRIEVAATPENTWKRLVQMPSMEGTKPFLLRIGLPVPNHCTLEGEAVGARRVCHFDQGIIGQEITEWDEPERMAVKTTESTLPGRHWLKFMNAEYDLKATPNGTTVIRRTSIGSKLYPRWYWRPFEAWGVESEHEFVLTSLKQAVEAGN